MLIPGGFGERAIEGKINVIKYCRENNIPFLGLCYGMQLAVVEYARNVCGLKEAHTTEINREAKFPVIDVMPDQKNNLRKKNFGATMRLGAYQCELTPGTKAYKYYDKQSKISERHRHRYELNNTYRDQLESSGLVISGINPEKGLVEIIELSKHKFFIATQFHPELKSRPFKPHPLFAAFIKIAAK